MFCYGDITYIYFDAQTVVACLASVQFNLILTLMLNVYILKLYILYFRVRLNIRHSFTKFSPHGYFQDCILTA